MFLRKWHRVSQLFSDWQIHLECNHVGFCQKELPESHGNVGITPSILPQWTGSIWINAQVLIELWSKIDVTIRSSHRKWNTGIPSLALKTAGITSCKKDQVPRSLEPDRPWDFLERRRWSKLLRKRRDPGFLASQALCKFNWPFLQFHFQPKLFGKFMHSPGIMTVNFLANVLFAELLTRCGTYCASEQANCTGEKMEKVVKCVKSILSEKGLWFGLTAPYMHFSLIKMNRPLNRRMPVLPD